MSIGLYVKVCLVSGFVLHLVIGVWCADLLVQPLLVLCFTCFCRIEYLFVFDVQTCINRGVQTSRGADATSHALSSCHCIMCPANAWFTGLSTKTGYIVSY